MSRGFLSGGLCPGGFCPGDFVLRHLWDQPAGAVYVGYRFEVRELCQTCPRIGQSTCFRQWLVFGEVTPTARVNLKTYRTDY